MPVFSWASAFRAVLHAEGLQHAAGVRAGEVVALPAAAVVEDLVAADRVADAHQALGDLGDGDVPRHLFERAVVATAQRRGEPVSPVLVVVDPQGLLAGVALRGGMLLVAPHTGDLAAVEPHLDAAVVRAQHAGGLVPDLGGVFLDAVGLLHPAHRRRFRQSAWRAELRVGRWHRTWCFLRRQAAWTRQGYGAAETVAGIGTRAR